MNTLISFPEKIVFTEYYTNTNIIFIDETGWWIYDKLDNKRKSHPIGFSKFFSLNTINPSGLRESLNWWSPIWTRWMAKSFKYELYRISSIEIIDNIVNDLHFLQMRSSLINTGVPHHVDTSLLQLALSFAKIPQIFLYSNVIDGRLIPLIQNKSIFDRRIITSNISKIDYEDKLILFLNNRIAGNTPILNTKITSYKKNIYLSIFYSIYLFSRNYLKTLISSRSSKIIKWSNFYHEINIFESINLMKVQRNFLKLYDKTKLNINESFNLINNNNAKIIIAAHYQPEATSFPEGGNFSNHIEIIMKIRSLGYNELIGYKEHPATWMYIDNIIGPTRVGIYRSKEYLNQLTRLKCVFIHEKYTLPISKNKIQNYIPITISGTIAIERSLLGLHTIVAGEPWYKGLPGIIMLSNLTSLRQIPSEWLRHSPIIEIQAKNFLLKLLNNSTITNSIGVGTGILTTDLKLVNIFKNEFNQLLITIDKIINNENTN
jgi:hypothetical protein